jgi:hypothetical protein
LFELSTRQRNFPLPQSCQCEQDLRKRLQIIALSSRHFKLYHPSLSIAPDAAYSQKDPLVPGQTAYDVVGRAEGNLCVGRIRLHSEKPSGIALALANEAQTLQLMPFDQACIVSQHAGCDCKREKGIGVCGIRLEAFAC